MQDNFTDIELRCRCGCGLFRLHPGFRAELQRLRDRLDEPMLVTSCCRCRRHNAEVGGHPRSMHVGDFPAQARLLGTAAIDIAARDGALRGRLFAAAWNLGWSLGWNAKAGFLHLDRRDFAGLSQTTFDY